MNAVIDPTDPKIRANPYPTYAYLREHHPVCRVDPEGIVGFCRHQQVKAALRDYRTFSSHGFRVMLAPDWFQDEVRANSMLAKDPPEHTRLRALVNKAFTPGVIASLEAGMSEVAEELVSQFRHASHIELLNDFSYPYLSRIIGRIIGFEPEVYPQIKQWLDTLAFVRPAPPSAEMQKEIHASQARMVERSRKLVIERRERPRQDLVSRFVNAEVDGEKLTELECISMLNLLIGAGFETTVNLLTNALRQLSVMPELVAELYNAPQRIEAFIDEVLRFDPPTHALLRQVTEDVGFGGVDLAAGTNVFLLIGSACRDPEVYREPERFDIEREQGSELLAFGFGAHACVGRLLARLEATVAIRAFVNAFAAVQCPSADELDWKTHLVSRGVNTLPVTLQRRF